MTIEKSMESEFEEFAITVFHQWGIDTPTCRLFAILYLESNEVSIDDLAKRTGYSLASVSNKMRLLLGSHVIRRIKKPGSKKVYYYGEKNLKKIFGLKIDKAILTEVEPAKAIIPNMLKKYAKAKLSVDGKKKYSVINNYYKQILQFEKFLIKMKKEFESIK